MPNPCIVFIEDDVFLASIYAEKLEKHGMAVVLATNGEDGLKMIDKHSPQLILLDLVMPKMDGFQVLEHLHATGQVKKCPVLVFSNLSHKEDIERCLKLGAAAYLIKAHTLPHELLNKIKGLIDGAAVV